MRGEVLLLLADGLVILCLTRCLLQWARLDANHPLLHFCAQATDWLVKPLRKIAPPLGRWDIACVLAGWLLYHLAFMLITWVSLPNGFSAKIAAAHFLLAVLSVLKAGAYVLLLGLVIRVVVSFRDPYSALSATLQRIFIPILSPFSFLKLGRIDFSGSILALALWLWLSRLLPQLIRQLNLWLLQ